MYHVDIVAFGCVWAIFELGTHVFLESHLSRSFSLVGFSENDVRGLDFKDNRPKDIADLFHDPCKKTIEDNTVQVLAF